MIPKHHEFFPHILEVLSDKKTYRLRDIRDRIAKMIDISEEDRQKLLPSKTQSIFDNRVNWACVYLKKAGVVDTPKRGQYLLTKRGEKVIDQKGFQITLDDLNQFKSFREFIGLTESADENNGEKDDDSVDKTPEAQLYDAIEKINSQLSDEILSEIMSMSPVFFERLVLDLLRQMGYGGKDERSFIHTQYTQDDGIDGMIKEDELGLDYIYVQAKRWSSGVGQPEIQKFSGALSGKGATKGVFLTTSHFSKQAISYAENHHGSTIVLVDGRKLTDLMITYGVGLTTEYTYKLQKIDKDYFDEDRI